MVIKHFIFFFFLVRRPLILIGSDRRRYGKGLSSNAKFRISPNIKTMVHVRYIFPSKHALHVRVNIRSKSFEIHRSPAHFALRRARILHTHELNAPAHNNNARHYTKWLDADVSNRKQWLGPNMANTESTTFSNVEFFGYATRAFDGPHVRRECVEPHRHRSVCSRPGHPGRSILRKTRRTVRK